MANIFFDFHIGMSQMLTKFQMPAKFYLETKKTLPFSSQRGLRFPKGSNRFDLTLLSPLASLLKVFKPTRIQDHIGRTWELKFQLIFDNVNPSAHTNHNPIFLTPSFYLTKQNNRKTTHTLPLVTASRILTKNHNPLLYDQPHKFNGLLQFFGVPKNEGTLF